MSELPRYNPVGVIFLFFVQFLETALIISIYHNDIREYAKQKDSLVQQLRLKNTELERFAYITSHDLKEPAHTVKSFAGMLKKQLIQQKLGHEQLEMIDIIDTSATRMSNMIVDILKYSKLELKSIDVEAINLEEIILQFQKENKQLINDKKARIQVGKLPPIKSNRLFITLLFQNLLFNALKYNNSEVPIVKIFGHVNRGGVLLSVQDNGIGIDAKYHEYVFEPFRRLNNRNQYDGTGLGLSICKKIVNNFDGKIWVQSEEEGSTFYVQLPQ
ncbi:MAG: ATP-binding protein [Bacteroidota bacterium]